MESANTLRCPFCDKLHPSNTERCLCGYYFDKAKYNEVAKNKELKTVKYEDKYIYPGLKTAVTLFYITGFVCWALALFSFIWGVTSIAKDNTISGISVTLILTIVFFIAGLFQISSAELIKILIRIEINTRNALAK